MSFVFFATSWVGSIVSAAVRIIGTTYSILFSFLITINTSINDPKMGIPKSTSHESAFKIPDVPNPNHEDVEDWAAELRPSMRKLRQGMDALCKTSRCGFIA